MTLSVSASVVSPSDDDDSDSVSYSVSVAVVVTDALGPWASLIRPWASLTRIDALVSLSIASPKKNVTVTNCSHSRKTEYNQQRMVILSRSFCCFLYLVIDSPFPSN